MVFTNQVNFVQYDEIDDLWQPEVEFEIDFEKLNTQTFASFKRTMFSYLTFEAANNNEDERHHEIMAIFAWVHEYGKLRVKQLKILNERQWQILQKTVLYCDLQVEFCKNPDNKDSIGNTEPRLPDIREDMKSQDYWLEGLWNRLPYQRSSLSKTGRSWDDIDIRWSRS